MVNFIKVRYYMFGPIISILIAIYYYFLLLGISYLIYPLDYHNIIIIAIFLGFLNCVSFMVEYNLPNPITQFTLKISESLKWVAVILPFFLIPFYILNITLNVPQIYFRILILLIPCLFVYGYYNAHKLKVKEHTLYFDNLKEDINIVHLSDVHIGSIRSPDLIKNISLKLNEINPDLAIISGDLADGSRPISDNMFTDFNLSKVPIIFTPGNHDCYQGLDNLFNSLKKTNIIILNNEFMDFKGLHIYGNSFGYMFNGDCLDKSKVNIIINHIPDNWDTFSKLGFNLQLSGHTHGGQFFPANFFVKKSFPYNKGLFKKNNHYLSVTAGVGTMGPPLRVGTNSELVLLKLRKK